MLGYILRLIGCFYIYSLLLSMLVLNVICNFSISEKFAIFLLTNPPNHRQRFLDNRREESTG